MTPTTNEKFRYLFDEYFEAIARYCLRRLPTAEVNDATAEVFLVTWKKINQVPEGEQALPWLYGVARNVVRNSLRSSRRSYRLVGRLRGLAPVSEVGPELQVIRRDEDQRLVEALSRLDSDDQEVLRLRAYEGMTSPQIAVALGCSEEAAKKRVARALQRLRRVAGASLGPDRRRMHPGVIPVGGVER